MKSVEVKDLSRATRLSAAEAHAVHGGFFGSRYFSKFVIFTPYNPDPNTGGYLAREYQDWLRRRRY